MTINERIKSLRKDRRLTQREVADVLQIQSTAYSDIERGIRKISVSDLVVLCNLYEVSADYILFGKVQFTLSKGNKQTTDIIEAMATIPLEDGDTLLNGIAVDLQEWLRFCQSFYRIVELKGGNVDSETYSDMGYEYFMRLKPLFDDFIDRYDKYGRRNEARGSR